MKDKHLLITSCLLILGGATSSFAAYTLTNGNFASNDTTGWTATGTVTAASGAAVMSTGAVLHQDFSNGTAATGVNYDFQLDFQISYSNVATLNDANRIRLRGNVYSSGSSFNSGTGTWEGEQISLRYNPTVGAYQTYNQPSGSWLNILTINLSSATNYSIRIIGQNFDTPATRSYTLGVSTDGTNYTTSGPITALQVNDGYIRDFESIGFETGTGPSFTIDNVSVVPESGAALLGSLGALALLRRRRA